MKDYELSATIHEPRLKQPGGSRNESSSVWPTSERRSPVQPAEADSRTRNNSPQTGPSPKVCSPEFEHHADTWTGEARSASCESGHQVMEAGDVDQSEKPKHPKKRRQRRKCAAQQVVGLPRAPSAAAPVLLWFRRDLRLSDNPALISALKVGAPVIPIFIWSPEEEEGPGVTVAMGGACKSGNQTATASFPHLHCAGWLIKYLWDHR